MKTKRFKKVEELIEQICGDLSSPGTGIFSTLPVDYIKGLIKEAE